MKDPHVDRVAKGSELLAVVRVSMHVGRRCMRAYSHAKSPKVFTQPQLLACLVLKAYTRSTYRGVIELLALMPSVYEAIGLRQLPDHSTLCKFAERKDVQAIVDRCLTELVDFMEDQLFDGRKFRLLTLVDDFGRESLTNDLDQRLTGERVAAILDRVARERGLPEKIRVDNGSEFTGRVLDQWAYVNNVRLDFSRRGKPTDNGLIEAFNGRLRAECLNENWFMSIDDAR